MSATLLLAKLRQRGITLEIHGDRLRYRPLNAVSAELRLELAANKADLIRLLTEVTPQPSDDAPADLYLTELDRRVVEAIRAGETIKFTAPPAPDPEIPSGWTRAAWIGRLRQLADRCAEVRPDLAIKHRAEADRLDQTNKPTHGRTTNGDK